MYLSKKTPSWEQGLLRCCQASRQRILELYIAHLRRPDYHRVFLSHRLLAASQRCYCSFLSVLHIRPRARP